MHAPIIPPFRLPLRSKPMTDAAVSKWFSFFLGMLGAAFGAGVSWGIIQSQLSHKANVEDLVALKAENSAAHTIMVNDINVKLDRINESVLTIQSLVCDQQKADSYCRTRRGTH